MMTRTLTEFLIDHKASKPVSFHVPGHKGRPDLFLRYGYEDFLRNSLGNDITEINGADNLHHPTGIIRDIMDRYAGLYGAMHTELLVNGGSAGVIAAILASVPRGGKIIMARNSHRSAYNALRLGGIEPVYVVPGYDREGNVSLGVPASEIRYALADHPDAHAVFITSPTYSGVVSEIEDIASAVHAKGKILIVDQAHGSHLKFFDESAEATRKAPRVAEYRAAGSSTERRSGSSTASAANGGWNGLMSAEKCGADIVIDNTHKTLLSFTGTAVLNICSDRVDIDTVSHVLSMIQTTSPSYSALGSLDINERIMREGSGEIVSRWKDDIRYLYNELGEMRGVRTLAVSRSASGVRIDASKISLSMIDLGISGKALDKALNERNIWTEASDRHGVLLVTGAGNVRSDYECLVKALGEINSKHSAFSDIYPEDLWDDKERVAVMREIPKYAGIPLRKETIPLYQAEGRVAFSEITPYPPGVPLVCPGEVLSYEAISYLSRLVAAGDNVIGVDEEGMIEVGE